MIKVYIDNPLNFSLIPLLYPNLGFQHKDTILFSDGAFKYIKGEMVKIEGNPSLADFLLIPHNFFLIKEKKEYIQTFVSISKKHGKKIIIFAYGDSDEDIDIPNSIIFRTSRYGSQQKENEIIMPAFVEDLSDSCDFEPRTKRSGKPVVGFCGWAEFGGVLQNIKLGVKNILASYTKGNVFRQGLWFRKRVIEALRKSHAVETNFIIRKFYSGHRKTIKMPPEQARVEYIENLRNCDLALVVKGAGNFSFRFYEALSAGRVPLFVDTDCVLPLGNIIDYTKFVLFVDYKDIDRMGEIVSEFYGKISDEEFFVMQKTAREAFDGCLRADKFFEIMFLSGKILEYA